MSRAMGRFLMGLGSGVGNLVREREAQALRDADIAREEARYANEQAYREKQDQLLNARYEQGLRMTPGVYEASATRTRDIAGPDVSPLPSLSMPEIGLKGNARPGALESAAKTVFDIPKLEVPDFNTTVTEANPLEPGHTRLTPDLAFNPNLEEDLKAKERERRLGVITEIARNADDPIARARAAVENINPDSLLSFEQTLGRQRRINLLPQWTQPPQPDLVIDETGQYHYLPVRPGATGIKPFLTGTGSAVRPPAGGRGTGTGRVATVDDVGANEVLKLVQDSNEYSDKTPEEQVQIAREIMNGTRAAPPMPGPDEQLGGVPLLGTITANPPGQHRLLAPDTPRTSDTSSFMARGRQAAAPTPTTSGSLIAPSTEEVGPRRTLGQAEIDTVRAGLPQLRQQPEYAGKSDDEILRDMDFSFSQRKAILGDDLGPFAR